MERPKLTIRHSGPAPTGDAPPTRQPWRQRPTVRGLVAAVTFVLGLAAGGVIVGFAVTGRKPPLPKRTVTVTPTPRAPGAAAGSGSPAAGVAVVNEQCLRAINDSQTSFNGLGELVAAVRALDASRIDHVLLQLQARQTQLKRDLRTCHVTARVATATPTPAPSPSNS
jgi:hypothetical protein